MTLLRVSDWKIWFNVLRCKNVQPMSLVGQSSNLESEFITLEGVCQ